MGLSATVTALLALAATASAAPGDLDPTYSGDGRMTINLGQDEERPEIELDSQGRLVVSVETGETTCSRVVCSYDYDKALLRVETSGERDMSFGSDGLIGIDGETNPDVGQLQLGFGLQSDATMIVRSGFRLYAIRPGGATEWSQPIDWCCQGPLRVLSDDSLLIGGNAAAGGPPTPILLERRTPAGLSDPAFGDDGFVEISVGDYATVEYLLEQDDGRIVAIGTHRPAFGPAVARLLPDGSLDPSFGDGGIGVYPYEQAQYPAGAGLQSDGSLIVASQSPGVEGPRLLRRVSPDGSTDPGFDARGLADVPLDWIRAMEVLADDRIFVLGFNHAVLLRRDGSIDRSFGGGDGVVFTPRLGGAVARQQPDGAIVVAGSEYRRGSADRDLRLARYTLEDGPANADADDLLDAADHCPEVHGSRPSGCPRIPIELGLDYRLRKRKFNGTVGVDRGDEGCVDGIVVLRRKVRGRSKVVRRAALTKRRALKGFSLEFPRRRGRYRAILTPQTIPTLGECPRTKSDWVKVKPKRRSS